MVRLSRILFWHVGFGRCSPIHARISRRWRTTKPLNTSEEEAEASSSVPPWPTRLPRDMPEPTTLSSASTTRKASLPRPSAPTTGRGLPRGNNDKHNGGIQGPKATLSISFTSHIHPITVPVQPGRWRLSPADRGRCRSRRGPGGSALRCLHRPCPIR